MLFLDKTIELKPAYGRLYKTQKQFKKDFNDRKDFLIMNGPYMSKDNVNLMLEEGILNIYIKINFATVYVVRLGTIQGWVNK